MMRIDGSRLKVKPDEVLRYMGWKKKAEKDTDYQQFFHLAEKELERLKKMLQPRYVLASVNRIENQELFSALFEKESHGEKGVRKFIGAEETVFLAAATLGFEFETLLKAAGSGEPSQLLLLESCGTALIECVMDELETELRGQEGKECSSRFSPGYGGWSLENQRLILDYLHGDRIGIYLNEAHLMIPRKSVTAVIKMDRFGGGCGHCEKEDCHYRKQTE